MNKKKGIIITSIFLLVIATISGILVYNKMPSTMIHKLLDQGDRYLSELNYEQAIAVYRGVIELDSENAEVLNKMASAYIEWARSVLDSGDIDLAISILRTGYAETNNPDVLTLLDQLEQEKQASIKETESEIISEESEPAYELSEDDRSFLKQIVDGEMIFLENYQAGVYTNNLEAAFADAKKLVYDLENTEEFRRICRDWQNHYDGDQIEIKGDGYYMIARSFDSDHIDINVGEDGNGWFVGSAIENGMHDLIISPYSDRKANGTGCFFITPLDGSTPFMITRQNVDGVSTSEASRTDLGGETRTYTVSQDSNPGWWPEWYDRSVR